MSLSPPESDFPSLYNSLYHVHDHSGPAHLSVWLVGLDERNSCPTSEEHGLRVPHPSRVQLVATQQAKHRRAPRLDALARRGREECSLSNV